MSKPFSLSKHERLKSKKQIDALFLNGEAFFVFPYKIKFLLIKDEIPSCLKFGISVPKRLFKRAVDRNRVKRLSKEAYRTQKVDLKEMLAANGFTLHIMYLYAHNEILPDEQINAAVNKSLEKLSARVETEKNRHL